MILQEKTNGPCGWELTGLIRCAASGLDLGREGGDEGLGRADTLEVGQSAAGGTNAGRSCGLLHQTVREPLNHS